MAAKRLYTIPAGLPFAKALAEHLWKTHPPETLPHVQILLPTRRACRTVREAFLHMTEGRPLMLPRLQPLGDVEEDALALETLPGEDLLDLPPALSPLRRQLLLARLIYGLKDFSHSFEQALNLARALGHLMDQIHTEGLDFSALPALVPDDFAQHWQITLQFLDVLRLHWPRVLEEEGAIDAAERRVRLIRARTAQWKNHPPQTPVIAAGSTGSIPATAELLDVIAQLPQGVVVLPGLDTAMDEASWDSMTESHPQYGFKILLQHLQVEREGVTLWPAAGGAAHPQRMKARRLLAREMMRPAATSETWTDLRTQEIFQKALPQAMEGLRRAVCKHEQEEAQCIALSLRAALETPGKTAVLITPDRALARRVAAACRRWGLQIDDSGGQTLDQTPHGHFLLAVLQACAAQLAPVALLALLKHPLCQPWPDCESYQDAVATLENLALRGPRPAPGIAALQARLTDAAQAGAETASAQKLLQTIEELFPPLLKLCADPSPQKIAALAVAHLALAERLAGDTLWRGADGESSALFFADFLQQSRDMPALPPEDYGLVLRQLLRQVTVRPAYGAHPRLQILGQLEARLVAADQIILGGLNEGVWPPDPGHDPWMSRPMRKDFGLPAADRAIGLSAHDFVQAFCGGDILLTSAERREGAPATPARWLQRLDAVLLAANVSNDVLQARTLLGLARRLDRPDTVQRIARPAPTPAKAHRPRNLSVTDIETWLQDPYGLYARAVLRLRKLKPLEQEPDAAQRGIFLHQVFEQFLRAHPDALPEDALPALLKIAQQSRDALHDDPAVWRFWWPRFERIAAAFIALESGRRGVCQPVITEGKGAYTFPSALGDFTLTARVDRIDRQGDQGLLIDYKSGGTFTLKGLSTGQYPQLPLEGVILQHGGFAEAGALSPAAFSYWIMTGGAKPIQIVEITENAPDIAARAESDLKNLIAAYADESTPYHSLPRPEKKPRFSDYAHLARVGEWAVIGSDSDSSAESEAA